MSKTAGQGQCCGQVSVKFSQLLLTAEKAYTELLPEIIFSIEACKGRRLCLLLRLKVQSQVEQC